MSASDLRPLWEIAAKLTHPKCPAWQRCPSLVFPAWTAKRAVSWVAAERKIPSGHAYCSGNEREQIMAYVEAFDSLNHLKPAIVWKACDDDRQAA